MCDADGTGASALIFQNEKKKGARNGRTKLQKVL
jgi:hypothetical protein